MEYPGCLSGHRCTVNPCVLWVVGGWRPNPVTNSHNPQIVDTHPQRFKCYKMAKNYFCSISSEFFKKRESLPPTPLKKILNSVFTVHHRKIVWKPTEHIRSFCIAAEVQSQFSKCLAKHFFLRPVGRVSKYPSRNKHAYPS